MSNDSRGRKKSQFVGQSTISNTDTLDFVTGNTNRKITFGDFKAGLGVTGTIVQQGAVIATPVLNQTGSINNIRNLEDGSGVKASVSAQGGITLDHNFKQDTVGVPILINPTLSQPTIASLEGVDGVTVTADSEHIEIGFSAVQVSTKTVVVNEIGDLPTAVGGVITLLDQTEYLFTNDVDLGTDRLVLSDTTIRGSESTLITLTYSGTGDMITMLNAVCRVSNITLSCASGRLFNWICNTGNHIFRCNDVSFVCDKIGVFDASSGGIIRFTNVSGTVATDGVEFLGDYRSFLWEVSATTMTAGAMFNLGTATFDSFIVDTILATLNGSSSLISGAASSANINAGGIGLVNTMRISGAGTSLSGISVDDALWEFRHNDDIADTRPDGLLSMQGNATDTVIAVAGTPVLVAGTWVVDSTSQMTGTAAGRITYNGGKDAKLPITASLTVEPATGGAVDISAEVAINGTVVANSKRVASASAGNPSSITVPWQTNFSPTDFVEVFVTNEDSTVDVLVSSAVLRIN